MTDADNSLNAPREQDVALAPKPLWYGGLDRSGTSDLRLSGSSHDPYVTVIAMMTFPNGDTSLLGQGLSFVRQQFGIATGLELHAHQLSDEIRCAILNAAQNYNLTIGTVIVDKARSLAEWPSGYPLATSKQLREASTEVLATRFFQRYQLAKLWPDEDVRSREAEEEKTALLRLHRAAWPSARMQCQHKSSRNNDFIQIADVVAYCLRIHIRASIRSEALREIMRYLWSAPNSIVLGPAVYTAEGLQFFESP